MSSCPGGTCSSSQVHEVPGGLAGEATWWCELVSWCTWWWLPHWEVAGPWDGGDVGGLDVAIGGSVRSGAWVGGRVGGLDGGDVGGLGVTIGGRVRPGA